MQQAKLPESIAIAVNTLLSPYGISVNALTKPQQQDDKVKYFSLRAAGIYASISRWSLSRAIKANKLPAIKMNQAKTGKVLIAQADLDKWILSHRMKVA